MQFKNNNHPKPKQKDHQPQKRIESQYYSQETEANQVPIDRHMGKRAVVHTHNATLLDHKKE